MGGSGIDKDVWHKGVRTLALLNNVNPRRWGMRVTVYADANPANNGEYVLSYNLNSTQLADNANWLLVAAQGATWGGGGGGSTQAKSQGFTTDGATSLFAVTNGTVDQINFVEVNGIVQRPGIDYTVAGNDIDFGANLPASPGGVNLVIYYYEDVSLSTDFLQSVEVDTTGASIDLDLASQKQRVFRGSASIAAAKAITLSNAVNGLVFTWHLAVSGARVLTFPGSFIAQSPETRWNAGTKELTLTGTANTKFEITATFDGANWKLKASADFN